ncbi:Eco57I restriction-modification methylase domain-containing protein [Stappia sp. ES.058]|uniref:Eco57I restriction-modification methylase domain-containing protein n=1 Tax=Stappia sp. ES.058 TaxID=1881061 RepID=UPI00087B6D56|nr:Eco57I restriction-modification methylase domain-containing protein [Stappia sp. ES.058]SDU42631.1 Eco57I restriction-modification methylase [Stappia sp. ES.058]
MIESIIQGSLFTADFITQSIKENTDWQTITDDEVDDLREKLSGLFDAFPSEQSPNETRTEDDLIWPILKILGWDQFMRQQNLTVKGRDDVPDGLLFADADTKIQADQFPEEYKRYQFGLAIVESKRWRRPLDRQSGKRGEELAPSTQMLRYLRRVDDLTTGNLRWGILTNGGRWRLYFSGARSVSEQFFEIDLAAVLGIAGHGDGLFALDDEQKRHALRVFALVFRKQAFLPSATDPRTFHIRALEEGKFYEERVASDLSDLVFDKLYPLLARSIADKAPDAPLQDVREAALILLYRLLFILYAEDRDLLPVNDRRYDDYGLRDRVRLDVGDRKDKGDTFSNTAARYWSVLDDLCRAIDEGDTSIGLPPYNGGLFDPERTPLLRQVRLSDSVMAEVIDKLSFERADDTRKYINYRDLSVQQLGSIYERLLEHEVVREGAIVDIRPNIFARKGSGSYYTPDDLVNLIIRETLEPLIEARLAAFRNKAEELAASDQDEGRKLGILRRLDPAERLLDLKICDPAMGSGHFLVSLVDYMADQVITAMAETETMVEWADYISPLADRIEGIRNTILGNAEERSWTVDPEQLDDRHIIRRMVLKRCVYGVDKNQMAVELAKVALWLHSFTVGAPLSFLDHHLRCGDSLFGSWVKTGIEKATAYGSPLLLHEPVKTALGSAASVQTIEGLPDAEIAEAHRSQEIFEGVQVMTAPLNAFLSLLHAIEWQNLKGKDNAKAIQGFFDGSFGDPFEIALGKREPQVRDDHGRRFLEILNVARELVAEERFLNWQVAFPGVWTDWENEGLSGGFDAIIGNPPWDRMKLQQVEWFAARKREIAFAQKAADRKRMIDELERNNDPLSGDFIKANERAEAATRMARSGGDYLLLSGGDVNIYSLFVERAMALVKRDGMVGLLTPSGIASDKTSSTFFKGVSTQGRLKALYDFENRRTRYNAPPFFPDVDSRFKFCVFVASPSPTPEAAMCAFFLQSVAELNDTEQRFPLTAEDFSRVNPNTGTAPIFRSRRDAELTTAIYSSGKILSDRSGDEEIKAWPLKYCTMFHMTNDSGHFRTRQELEEQEGGWHKGGNRYGSPKGDWVPLYEGKMIQAFDHRAASVIVNPENQHRPAQPEPATLEQHRDPSWLPAPQFWVLEEKCKWPTEWGWVLGFKEITAPTNVRTFIAALLPTVAFGNKVPLLLRQDESREEWLLAANLNSIPFDYVTRQKVQGQTLNLFIVEQLPVISPERFHESKFGSSSAAELLRDIVLELTYTAEDMAPFARDMGYTNDAGNVLPPFEWDEERRLRLRAKLDAIFFHLYGITDREDVRHIYSTFPIVERQERELYGGQYRSSDLCLAYLSALAAGSTETDMVA